MNRYFAMAIVLAACAAAQAAEKLTQPAKGTSTYQIFGTAEHFEWKEYVNGDEIVKETGPLFGVGIDTTMRMSPTVDIDGHGRIFFGQVDYDGSIINLEDGTETPAKAETDYFGIEIEGDLARPFPTTSGLTVRPLAGLNARYWMRALDNSDHAGYDEYWMTLAVRAGIELRVKGLYGRVALRAPIYNYETVDLSENGGPDDIELEPGKELSFDGEVGYTFAKWFVAVYIETLEFSESDPENDTEFEFFQPESKSEIVGVRGGWVF